MVILAGVNTGQALKKPAAGERLVRDYSRLVWC